MSRWQHPLPGPEGSVQRYIDELQLLHAIRLSVVATDASGTITFANEAAAELYGEGGEGGGDLVGRDLTDFLGDPADSEQLRDTVRAVLGGHLWSGELSARTLSGERFLARVVSTPLTDAEGRAIGLVVVSEDITDLRLAETEKHASDQRLRLALQAARLGTWHWDAATGDNIWDARLEEIYGLPPGGFGRSWEAWMELLHPEDRPEVVDAVTRVMADPAPYLLKTRVVWPDRQTIRSIEAWGEVTTDAEGNPTGTIGCVRDVTYEKETERALAVALEAERLASRRTALLLGVTADLAGAGNVIEVRRAMEHHLEKFIAELGDTAALALPSSLATVQTGADLAVRGYDLMATPDRTVLDALATQCSSAVHRVDLMARTTEIAEDLQLGLAASPLPTDVGDVEMAVHYAPGGSELEHVGGDWYDAVRTREGHLAVVIGDVMGRGVRAATTMVRVRAALRGLITVDPSPDSLLAFADDVLERDAPDQFVTAAAALLDPASRRLRVCVAGHVPIVMAHPDGTTELLGEESGIPLGVEPDVARRAFDVALPPGATLVLVTDGVVESRRGHLDDGIAGLRDRVSQLRERPLKDLVAGVAALADSSMHDDVTVLAIRVP